MATAIGKAGSSMARKRTVIATVLAGILFAIAAYLLFIGFKPASEVRIVGYPPLEYPPFQTWPTPRSFDGPGTLFTLDDGHFNYLGALDVEAENVGDETFPTFNGTAKWEGSVLGQFLGIGETDINSHSGLDVKLTLGDGHRWRLNPDKLKVALAEWVEQNPNKMPYLVIESISVERIAYTIGSQEDFKGVVSSQTEVADGKVSATRNAAGNWTFQSTYERPHYVFYRVVKIDVLQGLNKPHIIQTEPKEPLRWREESTR